MESVWEDVRLSARGLLRTPGITAAALLALALGIGANTALFSVASATLWRDLPFRDPDRLVLFSEEGVGDTMFPSPVTRTALHEWRRRSRTLSGIVGMSHSWRNLTAPGPPELVKVSFVTANYLEVTGAELIAGRGFREDEARREGRVALISERLFRERFGNDPGRLRQGIVLDGLRHAVIGVAPRRFAIYGDWDVWLPAEFRQTPETRGLSNIRILGRLAPGVTRQMAERELKSIVGDLVRLNVDVDPHWVIRLHPLWVDRMTEVHEALRVLGILVAFVLLIACADVAGLLLARAAARERDLALRAILGAGRASLVRRQLTEAILLFLTGGLLGLLLALWGTPVLAGLSPDPLPDGGSRVDARVLLFTLAISLGTGLLFGLIPALVVIRSRLAESVQDGRRLAGTPGGRLLRNALVTGQVALTLVLSVTAILLLQSFDRLQEVNPGFDAKGVLSAKFRLARHASEKPERRAARYDRIVRSLEKIPGVQAAAVVDWLPFDQDQTFEMYAIEGRPCPQAGRDPSALTRRISPGYFRTIGIPLARGRDFRAADRAGAPTVVIVNQRLAGQCWPRENPIGKRLLFEGFETWATVVGIAQDTRQDELAFESMPEAYFPMAQDEGRSTVLLLRASGEASDWTAQLRKAVRPVEPGLAMDPLHALEARLDVQLAPSRFKSLMAALFAVLAMFLAAIGIYGVISESVARRTHEIGIRVALGAREWNVLGQVIREGMRPVLAGVVLGLAITLPLSHSVAGRLFETPARDFATYLAATLGILCVGLVANYFPAQEATRVEPMAALRDE
ncbi:MAG TPA: ABC transporter permease [Thermoanaerobaculia bacterium]|nr:ABC transporter permease [Thermoanaerobaculia bacterium]